MISLGSINGINKYMCMLHAHENACYNFLVNKWYFDELYDIIFIQSSKKIGLFFWKTIDIKIIDRFGPDGLSLLIKNLSLRASKFQSGFIYQYAFMILIGLSALLTFLILY